MSTPLTIRYRFSFPNGETREISLQLDEDTLELQSPPLPALPAWTVLPFHQCEVCPLEAPLHPYCPIAAQLSRVVDSFNDHNSYDEVTVTVDDGVRRYSRETTLQMGLGGLVGIIMATGGCPELEPLRPMVRFHLPFASMEETEFRMVSMYLVAQYFRLMKGHQPDWSLQGLQAIYDNVHHVNKAFADRIRSASRKDAGVNALVILDCFARAVPFAARTLMHDYEKYFAAYFKA